MLAQTVEARRYDTGQAVRITIGGDLIQAIEPLHPEHGASSDALPWVGPAFFDIQVNGYAGQSFGSPDVTPQEVVRILEACLPHGVARLCPTLITNSFDTLAAGLRAIRQACEQHPWVDRMVPAIHLEGPYISPEDGPRGAHPLQHVRPPDWDEFRRLQDIAGGRIGLVTLAPEAPGALDFIRRLVAAGVRVALGHTAAQPEQITAAVDAGATLSTHLGNGAHRMLPRHPNYVWEQLADDRLWASLICDGQHLPASVVKCMVRAKTPERVILVSDVVELAGLPPGRYTQAGVEVDVLPDGRAVVAAQPQFLAGSTQMIDTAVVNVQRFAGVSLRDAIDMASVHPARLLGLPESALEPGSPAELVLIDPRGESPRFRPLIYGAGAGR